MVPSQNNWVESAMLQETFATTIFSATRRCNVGTMLQRFETMMLQRCVALKIVVANGFLSFDLWGVGRVHLT